MSDDVRVRLFRREGKALLAPCFAYQGDYGAISALHWVNDRRLDFGYEPGSGAKIETMCWPANDDPVEIVPHRVFKN